MSILQFPQERNHHKQIDDANKRYEGGRRRECLYHYARVLGGDLGAAVAAVGQRVGEVADDVVGPDPAVVVGVAARDRELIPLVDVVARAHGPAALQSLLHDAESGLYPVVVLSVDERVPYRVADETRRPIRVGQRQGNYRDHNEQQHRN